MLSPEPIWAKKAVTSATACRVSSWEPKLAYYHPSPKPLILAEWILPDTQTEQHPGWEKTQKGEQTTMESLEKQVSRVPRRASPGYNHLHRPEGFERRETVPWSASQCDHRNEPTRTFRLRPTRIFDCLVSSGSSVLQVSHSTHASSRIQIRFE